MTRLRVQYTKGTKLRYLSHLDMVRLIERAIRRAGLPIAYTEGFHPHIKIAFGPPLPLGLTSRAEYLDLQFARPPVGDVAARLSSVLPGGVEIVASKAIFKKARSLAAAINVAEYQVDVTDMLAEAELRSAMRDLLEKEHLPIRRVTPKETKTVDIRAHLKDVQVTEHDGKPTLTMRLGVGGEGHARPQEVLSVAFGLTDEEVLRFPIQRTEQFIETNGHLLTPLKTI
jgi:radical SAM-linked protein